MPIAQNQGHTNLECPTPSHPTMLVVSLFTLRPRELEVSFLYTKILIFWSWHTIVISFTRYGRAWKTEQYAVISL